MNTSSAIRSSPVRALDRMAQFRAPQSCKICGGPAVRFDSVDFNKFCDAEDFYRFGQSDVFVKYLRCLTCCFIFTTDFDDWKTEDFAQLVYNSDYVMVDEEYVQIRPEQYAKAFAERFHGCEQARILDYGSGAGVFVDAMRGYGYVNIEGFDPFSSPSRPKGTFDIITCFEVIEHSCDPVETLEDMQRLLRDDGCVIFSQTTQPHDILSLRGNWWYLAPRNGHVSTFSEEALVALGRRQNMIFHKGSNVYGFAPQFPSSYANLALEWVGPSYTTLRLLAPKELPSTAIAFPSADDVFWEPITDNGVWRTRKTSGTTLLWHGRWPAVSRLQIRLPFLKESEPGIAARCHLSVNAYKMPVRLDRGELVAEFNIEGCTNGQIALHLPAKPEAETNDVADGTVSSWLSIPVDQVPMTFLP